MRKNRILLNTLYVQTQGAYLRLEGETVRVEVDGELRLQVPLHHLGGLVLFGNAMISPQLLAKCAEGGKQVVWLSYSGRFRGRLEGPLSGNVLLRRAQHLALEDGEKLLSLVRAFVYGKVRNARAVLQRVAREREATPALSQALSQHDDVLRQLPYAQSVAAVRGLEGSAASTYFRAFPDMIRIPGFTFVGRIRRPPRDKVNALLSFISTLLLMDIVAALEAVGLDPQVGFLHTVRPGKPALALDLLEEFRSWWADRLVLALINRRQLDGDHFVERPGGAIYLTDEGRKIVLTAYQKRKEQEIQHPLLREGVPLGLIPHVQAKLLARYLRGDLAGYPPFLVR